MAGFIYSIAFSPDGGMLAFGSYHKAQLWNLNSDLPGNKVLTFDNEGGPARSVDFTPNGRYLIVSGWRGNIYLWDLANGNQPGQPIRLKEACGCVAGRKRIRQHRLALMAIRVWDYGRS
jgi:WD40 repeat protein